MVVQNCTSHLTLGDQINSILDCIDTDEINIFTDFTAIFLDRCCSAACHIIVVAEDNFEVITKLSQRVIGDLCT